MHYIYGVTVFEVVGGLLPLPGRYASLGLTVLGPELVNIAFFHIFMDRAGWLPVLAASVSAIFLPWQQRDNFAGLLQT